MIIEPIEDIFSLAGSMKSYALNEKKPHEIAIIEKKVWEKVAISRYKNH